MRLRVFMVSSAALVGLVTSALAQSTSTPSASLTLTEKTEVPGLSLSPGTYTVRVEDQLKDRMVIAVQKDGSKSAASLLAIPNSSLTAQNAPGPIDFDAGLKSKPTLRGFAFSGGVTAEFIYPKKDAVTLATANHVRVMAVDPASQGMSSLPHLSPGDMSEVTLWMLTPSPVEPGSGKPAIQAAHYQAPTPVAAPAAQTVAQQTAPAATDAQSTPTETAAAPSPAPVQSSADVQPTQNAYVSQKPAPPTGTTMVASNAGDVSVRTHSRQLPKTGSDMPVYELAGSLSLGLALWLRLRTLVLRRS